MTAVSLLARSARAHCSRRWIHASSVRRAITNLEMPAMSPTMEQGGIASWKKKEGESFVAGDVLLEIETDKATIDVEAQDDGVLGKILVPDGTKDVKVGKIIALLAAEGDDISNLEVPAEKPQPKRAEAAPAQQTSAPVSEAKPPPPLEPQASHSHSSKHPIHSRPLFPSVSRLLIEKNVSDPSAIKGTGIRGMLTKGDVLAHLGLASGPTGTFKETIQEQPAAAPTAKKDQPKVLDGPALRQLIVSTMLKSSIQARTPRSASPPPDFNSIIADYLPPSSEPPPRSTSAALIPAASLKGADYLEGLY